MMYNFGGSSAQLHIQLASQVITFVGEEYLSSPISKFQTHNSDPAILTTKEQIIQILTVDKHRNCVTFVTHQDIVGNLMRTF